MSGRLLASTVVVVALLALAADIFEVGVEPVTVLTIALVWVTTFYAWQNWKMAQEMKTSREWSERAELSRERSRQISATSLPTVEITSQVRNLQWSVSVLNDTKGTLFVKSILVGPHHHMLFPAEREDKQVRLFPVRRGLAPSNRDEINIPMEHLLRPGDAQSIRELRSYLVRFEVESVGLLGQHIIQALVWDGEQFARDGLALSFHEEEPTASLQRVYILPDVPDTEPIDILLG
jgi:hypothetical protein